MGGAEQSLLLLVRELRKRAVAVTVALFGDGPLRDQLSTLGVPAVRVSVPQRIRSVGGYRPGGTSLGVVALTVAALPTAVRFAAGARRVEPDVIHTNGMKAHLLAGLGGRLVGVPVVWHLHDFPPRGWLGHIFQRAARSLPRLVLANSEAVARAIRPMNSVCP